MIKPNSVLAKNNVKSRAVKGKEVVMNLSGQEIYLLNETASAVWNLLDGINSVQEIAKIIGDIFGQKESIVEKDVIALLEELEKEGLISIRQ